MPAQCHKQLASRGAEADPAPLANGCTFLWISPNTAVTTKEKLRTECPDMKDSTWADFEARNTVSAQLHEPITTPWKHNLVGESDEPSKDWDSPDLTIFLARVGFN